MQYLKQSTAVTLKIGPFLDETDGITVTPSLSITQPDVRVSKNGGGFAQKSAAGTAAYDEAGYYDISLSTTDTDTLGATKVAIHKETALPVWEEFSVLPANVYDSMFSTDKLQVDITEVNGVAQAATLDTIKTAVDLNQSSLIVIDGKASQIASIGANEFTVVSSYAELVTADASNKKDILIDTTITLDATANNVRMNFNSIAVKENITAFSIEAAEMVYFELRITGSTRDIKTRRTTGTGVVALNGGTHYNPQETFQGDGTLEIFDAIVIKPLSAILDNCLATGAVTSVSENEVTDLDDIPTILTDVSTIDDKVDLIQTGTTALIVDTTLLRKYSENRQEFVFDTPDWFFVVYDDDDVTEVLRQQVFTYDGGQISTLAGTDTPSERKKSSI